MAPTSGWRTASQTPCRNCEVGNVSLKERRYKVKKLHPVEFIIAATVLFGLVTVVRVPRLQGQNKIAGMAKLWAPSSGVTSSTQNPLQIGILHWYNANQTASFAAGSAQFGLTLAFDGLHIWVPNYNSNTVTE